MRKTIFCIMVSFCATGYCTAKTIYVDVNSPNDPGTGSHNDPFRRIQDAINDSNTENGDKVIVAQGIYTPNSSGGISFNAKQITLISTDPNDLNVVSATVINPNQLGRAFNFNTGEDADSILIGFKIINGCEENYGGGIYCLNSSPFISHCILTANSASYGGAIACIGADPIINNCIITNNTADNKGGAIALRDSNSTIINCTIVNNNSAVYCHTLEGGICKPLIINCIFAHNAGLAIEEYGSQADPNIRYSCFYNNSGGDWYNYDTSSTLTGSAAINLLPEASANICADPLTEPDGYHLKSNSPCINTGRYSENYNNTTDIDGQHRLLYEQVDIGADEVVPIHGDFEPDGDVDIKDLNVISIHWLETGPSVPGDIKDDNIVNFSDFAALANNWMLTSIRLVDLNHDKIINFRDFNILASYWMIDTCSELDWCNGSDYDKSGNIDVVDLMTFSENWLLRGD